MCDQMFFLGKCFVCGAYDFGLFVVRVVGVGDKYGDIEVDGGDGFDGVLDRGS